MHIKLLLVIVTLGLASSIPLGTSPNKLTSDDILAKSSTSSDSGQDSRRIQNVNSFTDIGSVFVENTDQGSQDKSFDSNTDLQRDTNLRTFRTRLSDDNFDDIDDKNLEDHP